MLLLSPQSSQPFWLNSNTNPFLLLTKYSHSFKPLPDRFLFAFSSMKQCDTFVTINDIGYCHKIKDESKTESEISEIEPLDLKDSKQSSSNTNEVEPLGDEEDEIDYM